MKTLARLLRPRLYLYEKTGVISDKLIDWNNALVHWADDYEDAHPEVHDDASLYAQVVSDEALRVLRPGIPTADRGDDLTDWDDPTTWGERPL